MYFMYLFICFHLLIVFIIYWNAKAIEITFFSNLLKLYFSSYRQEIILYKQYILTHRLVQGDPKYLILF